MSNRMTNEALRRAIEAAYESGRTARAVADDLGCCPSWVNWVWRRQPAPLGDEEMLALRDAIRAFAATIDPKDKGRGIATFVRGWVSGRLDREITVAQAYLLNRRVKNLPDPPES